MARKKKTPSDAASKADAPEVEVVSEAKSKAGAISGAVKGADFDTPNAAMADTSLEPADTFEDAEIIEEETSAPDVEEPILDTPSEAIDEAAPAAPPPVIAPEPQKGGFAGTVLGGVIAAVIGFGGAIIFDAAEWPVFGGKDTNIDALLSEQSTRLSDEMDKRVAALSGQIEAAQSQDVDARAALEARIDALPAFGGAEVLPEELQATLAAQKAEMEALQDNLNAMAALAEQQIETAQAEQRTAAEAEARVKARGALNAVRAALGSGDAFAQSIPDIEAAADVPAPLADIAQTGAPTTAELEAGFASAARTALSSSLKATAGDAPADRLAFFLKDQLGARSLTPRDGDDPDAVLSRAEAAVKAGDLDAALTTIDALPDVGKAALDEWAQQARTRNDALAAFEALAAALSAN